MEIKKETKFMGKIDELLTRGVEEIIKKKHLEKRLKSKKKLRLKLGVDPSRPDIHLGHAVLLRKLREFQNLGHKVIFLVGDYTGRIGDPSGQNKTRPMLSPAEIEKNAKTYLDQVGKILDVKKAEIRRNSEWFSKLTFSDIIKIASNFTVARILERDDFEKRLKKRIDISLHEILYPIMQAYDSVMLKADVEFGGTDQKFNMLAGRVLQKRMGQPEQDIFMTKILVGTDGTQKMSKSLNNYIGITEESKEMYGKVMSIPDNLIFDYAELCTNLSLESLKKYKNPRDAKAKVAFEIVKIYHSEKAAKEAEEEFNRVFKRKETPEKMSEYRVSDKKYRFVDLLVKSKLVPSKSESRRLIGQGGVKIDGEVVKEQEAEIQVEDGMIIQVGKRRFLRLKRG